MVDTMSFIKNGLVESNSKVNVRLQNVILEFPPVSFSNFLSCHSQLDWGSIELSVPVFFMKAWYVELDGFQPTRE
jgi:hypothetical protein